MIQSTICSLAQRMHRCALDYIENGNLANVVTVKVALGDMNGYREYLTPLALGVHERLIQSMGRDRPDRFMRTVLSKCCGYKY